MSDPAADTSKDTPLSDQGSHRFENGELHKGVTLRTGKKYQFVLANPDLTLKKVGEVLREIEKNEGALAVQCFVAELDYDRMSGLAQKWKDDPAKQEPNNPNAHIPPRFMLLPWMDDEQLPEEAREGLFKGDGAGPVMEMTQALADLGISCTPSKLFDEQVLKAWKAWRAQAKPAS